MNTGLHELTPNLSRLSAESKIAGWSLKLFCWKEITNQVQSSKGKIERIRYLHRYSTISNNLIYVSDKLPRNGNRDNWLEKRHRQRTRSRTRKIKSPTITIDSNKSYSLFERNKSIYDDQYLFWNYFSRW